MEMLGCMLVAMIVSFAVEEGNQHKWFLYMHLFRICFVKQAVSKFDHRKNFQNKLFRSRFNLQSDGCGKVCDRVIYSSKVKKKLITRKECRRLISCEVLRVFYNAHLNPIMLVQTTINCRAI